MLSKMALSSPTGTWASTAICWMRKALSRSSCNRCACPSMSVATRRDMSTLLSARVATRSGRATGKSRSMTSTASANWRRGTRPLATFVISEAIDLRYPAATAGVAASDLPVFGVRECSLSPFGNSPRPSSPVLISQDQCAAHNPGAALPCRGAELRASRGRARSEPPSCPGRGRGPAAPPAAVLGERGPAQGVDGLSSIPFVSCKETTVEIALSRSALLRPLLQQAQHCRGDGLYRLVRGWQWREG